MEQFFLYMITHFILCVTHYSLFVVGGVDVQISEENGGFHENQVETASCHRVLDSCEVLELYIQHDNARPHASPETQGLQRLQFKEVLPHSSCSSTLRFATSSLLKVKERLKGQHFNSDDEVKAAIRSWCRQQPTTFFSDGFALLVTYSLRSPHLLSRTEKCMEL